MIGDTVVGVVECADSSRFRVEVNTSFNPAYYDYIVWVMDATKGGVAYACHALVDGTATTTIAGKQPTKHTQIAIADFIRLVDSAHGFRQWQPALL